MENDGGDQVSVSSITIVYNGNTVVLAKGGAAYSNGEPTTTPFSVGSIYVLNAGFYTLASSPG